MVFGTCCHSEVLHGFGSIVEGLRVACNGNNGSGRTHAATTPVEVVNKKNQGTNREDKWL